MSANNDTLRAEIRRRLESHETPGDIARDLDLDYDAGTDSVVLPGWVADDGNADVEYPDAGTAREAADEYIADGSWGSDTESWALCVNTWRVGIDADGEDVMLDEDSLVVVQHPEEPDCAAAEDSRHRWRAPHELVGGMEENPGVRGGRGCAVDTLRVCILCGLARLAGGPSEGKDTEHDHEYVRYGDDARDVDVERLAAYHGEDMPEGLREDSALAACIRRSQEEDDENGENADTHEDASEA